MAQILMGSATAIEPQRILTEARNEPIYEDFLQYICMTGPLNLRLIAPEQWHKLSKMVQDSGTGFSQKGIETHFLNQLHIPSNKELGQYIEKLYNPVTDELTSRPVSTRNTHRTNSKLGKSEKPVASYKPEFPTYHSVKICVQGKAFSGKKTQAKLIAEQLGGLTVFDMSEILREALAFVDPNNQKEEVVDPKAKGKKPAEEKINIFAGLDTTQYKEIGIAILEQIQSVTGNKETLPGKDIDLISLVSDDGLLAQLFCQKLKLTFTEKEKTKEEKENKLREVITKEKELLEQISEAKAIEALPDDPKAKNAKKGGAKSPQEFEEELFQLLKPEISGWVLVDFPRNIN